MTTMVSAPDHQRVRVLGGELSRLLAREALGVGGGELVRQVGLVDVGGADFVGDADLRQKLAPPRRLRRQDDARRGHFSSHSVTGPSLTRSTSIMAPNSPVSTGVPVSRRRATNRSYSGIAVSGRAASMNDGRRPREASP